MQNNTLEYHKVVWLANKLAKLEIVYQAGNKGALIDAVHFCDKHSQPLPTWANQEILKVLSGLAKGEAKTINTWKKWLRDYRQNLKDLAIYYEVQDAREHGVEWKDVYEAAAALVSNKLEEEGGGKADAAEKAYKRAAKKMKTIPLLFYRLSTVQLHWPNGVHNPNVWGRIEKLIKAGKPKGVNKPQSD